MRRRVLALIGVVLAATSATAAVQSGWRWPSLPAGVSAPAVPNDNAMSAIKVALGRRLFYDRMLSHDNSMACADCHQQAKGFTDGLPTHLGVTGEMGVRNVPGLANVAWRGGLTWTDAGITSLEAQAMVPMTGTKPVEMGMAGAGAELTRRLANDDCYRRMFAQAFPKAGGHVDFTQVTAALGAFQRTMISFDSDWDRFKGGQGQAVSALARKGAAQFSASGCASCHSGPDFTDGKVHYVGTAAAREADDPAYGGKPPPPGFEPPPEQFRTPSLRNVAVTGPWMHDGRSETIDNAIRRHAAAGLIGADMPALLAFMETLTDQRFLTDAALGPPSPSCPIAS